MVRQNPTEYQLLHFISSWSSFSPFRGTIFGASKKSSGTLPWTIGHPDQQGGAEVTSRLPPKYGKIWWFLYRPNQWSGATIQSLSENIRKHPKSYIVWYETLQAFFRSRQLQWWVEIGAVQIGQCAHISEVHQGHLLELRTMEWWAHGLVGWCQVSHVIPWNTLNYTLWLFVA